MSVTAGWPVRTIAGSEVEDYFAVLGHAFGETASAELAALERSLLELDRSIAAYDGDRGRLVGTAGIYSQQMTVPGGPRPVAGVTAVAVLPTHRRRGVLSALMRHQLHDLHARGAEPVAALWASEATIYRRFGYGVASRDLSMSVPRRGNALGAEPLDPGLRARLVSPAESLDVVEPVYDAVRAARPGMYARDARWRRREIHDPPGERGGRSELRCVVVEDGAAVRAYARYAVEARWDATGPAGIVHVREAYGVDPPAYAALLRYLCDLDLTATVRLDHRPTDDPLLDLLTDARRAVPVLRDGLYVRLVDLGRALADRSYAADLDVVLDVRDPLCPWNAGRWRLGAAAGSAGVRSADADAECTRTDAPPDLALSVGDLGSAYLGSAGALHRLAASGRVEELRPGALAAASRAFSGDVEPWCPTVF